MHPTTPVAPSESPGRGALRVLGSLVWAVVLVLVVNTSIFLLFVMPPLLGALWAAAVGGTFFAWHLQTDPVTGRRRLGGWLEPRLHRVGPGWVGQAVLWTIAGTHGLVVLIQLVTGPLDIEASPFHARIAEFTETLGGWLAFAFAAALVVPLVEEFVFRGRLMSRVLAEWGAAPAILISSVAFALVHIGGPHPALLLVPLVVGMACGALVLITGSIWPAVALHGAWNGLLALLALVPEGSIEVPKTGPAVGPAALLGTALVVAGALGWLLLLRHLSPPMRYHPDEAP